MKTVGTFAFFIISWCSATLSPSVAVDGSAFQTVRVYLEQEHPSSDYGMTKLKEAADAMLVDDADKAEIVVISSSRLSTNYRMSSEHERITAEGYVIRRISADRIALLTVDATGSMYGLLDIAEQFQLGRTLRTMNEKTVNPALRLRGIKFNLPWNSYRRDESLQLHEKTIRDLKYWERFLDMMAENRLNALTLWNLHPYTYMIRAKNFPEACPYSDEELKTWQDFWHGLFRMASDRGIKTYVFNWNIMVSHAFAKAHNVADYCLETFPGKDFIGKGDYSPIVQQYMRESVIQLIEEYPELTGLGVSQNERMEGVDEQVWQNWIVNTYFDALEKANRKIELIVRAHTHPAPELTRKAVEDNAYRLGTVYIDVKFNWSHAHSSPDLMYIHGGSTSNVLWHPAPKNYKMVYTMRNEDFFVLRWGEPDFVRAVLKRNTQDYVGGYLIGSETYIPGKEYITRPGAHLTWTYAFEKQWLFYQVWGRLMYDPQTSDSVFANAYDRKYGIAYGDKLVQAHILADKMPLKLASFYSSSWDFTLYSEGFLANAPFRGKRLFDSLSPFISVNEIIETTTLDTNLVSIKDYVAGRSGASKVTPLQLADELRRNGEESLALIQDIHTPDPTLTHEIDDIRTWAHLSLYFSDKLKGGIALQQYRMTGNEERKKESIRYLEAALGSWMNVINITNRYLDEISLMHLNPKYVSSGNIRPLAKFSWANLLDEVKYDVRIAEQAIAVVR